MGTTGFNGITNTAYQGPVNGATGSNPGNVVDAFPRFVSNVVADQTTGNMPLTRSGIGTPAVYSHWSGDLQAMLTAGLLVQSPTRPGVYVETILDPTTNQPVRDGNGNAQPRPFG